MEYESLLLDPFSPDSSDIEKGGLKLVKNLVKRGGHWREVKGRQEIVSLATPYYPSGKFSDPSGLIYFSTEESRLYSYDDFAASITDRSKGGAAYTGSRWRFTRFGDAVIAASSSGGDPIQARIGSAATFADLITSADAPRFEFIGISKSHVIGANVLAGGGGVYASADDEQFCWCARNDATDWTPGNDRANFGFYKDPDGTRITQLACFEDFFLLFKPFGIRRYSYTGGAAVWEAQTVTRGAMGLGPENFRDSIVAAGRDVFYFSNAGPAVAVNGESAQLLGQGKWRRWITDALLDYGASGDFSMDAEYVESAHQIVWNYVPGYSLESHVQVVYDIDSGELGMIDTENFAPRIASVRGGLTYALESRPLQNVRFLEHDDVELTVTSLSDFTTSLVGELTTKDWSPSVGGAVRLHAIRPRWKVFLRGASMPQLSVTVRRSNDPLMETEVEEDTIALTADAPNGWTDVSSYSMSYSTFEFKIVVPSMGNASLKELVALDLAYQPVGKR